MKRSSIFAAAFAGSLAFAGGVAIAADSPAEETQSGMRGYLSPEQRLMLMMEHRGEWKNADERKAAREKIRAEWIAMSPQEREQKRAALQAKWDGLPPDQQQALRDQAEQWRQARARAGQ